MSFRTWLFAFAIGLTFSGSVQAQEEAQGADERANAQQKSANDLPFNVPIKIIEDDEAAKTSRASR